MESFVLDPETGAIETATLLAKTADGRVGLSFVVRYVDDPNMKLLVPSAMDERYLNPARPKDDKLESTRRSRRAADSRSSSKRRSSSVRRPFALEARPRGDHSLGTEGRCPCFSRVRGPVALWKRVGAVSKQRWARSWRPRLRHGPRPQSSAAVARWRTSAVPPSASRGHRWTSSSKTSAAARCRNRLLISPSLVLDEFRRLGRIYPWRLIVIYLGEEACCTITSRWGTSRSTPGGIHRSRPVACP